MPKTEACTIGKIAEILGVSPSTVSRAFNPSSRISDEVRAQILACAAQNGYTPNKAASRLSMKPLKIAFLYRSFYAYASREFLRGFSDAYRTLSDLKITYDCISVTEEGKTAQHIHEILSQLTDIDGLIISGFNHPDIVAQFNAYAATGKPIVLLQNDVPTLDPLFLSCLDAKTAGEMAAEFIGNCLKRAKHRNVVLFTGSRQFLLHREAETLFRTRAAEFGFTLLRSYDMDDNPDILAAQVKELYETDGCIPDAVYITSGLSIPLCEYFKAHSLHLQTDLITFDLSPDIAGYLRDGIVTATIHQNQYRQAKIAFTALVHHLTGQPMETGDIAPILVMKGNMKYYI